MAKVNTTSVREEFERQRTEFERLSNAGKIGAETKLLISSMFVLFELLISVFMEKSTRKNNKNSSKPSSQTAKDESASIQAGSKGRG